MYLGGVGTGPETEILRQLAGTRVLLTGISPAEGVDLARSFADLGTRLVIQTGDLGPEMTELAAVLSQSAQDLKLFAQPLTRADDTVAFARAASQAFGGLDAVVNLTRVTREEMTAARTDDAVDTLISAKLAPTAYLTQVTINRMRTVVSEGLILNVLLMPVAVTPRESAIIALARTALTAITVAEARNAEHDGIRVNAIGPRVFSNGEPPPGACVNNGPDLAALALYLASRRGRALSGHVFDAVA